MAEFVSPCRVIVTENSYQELVTTINIPELFEDVYSFNNNPGAKGPKINLPLYISYNTEDIDQHRVIIYLISRIAEVREHNRKVKHEDDIIDEISAYSDTIMHFGTDEVTDYINNYDHCDVIQHVVNILQLYTMNGYHEPHLNKHSLTILRRRPGTLLEPEIEI